MSLVSDIAIRLRTALNTRERLANKNIANGYAGLDYNSKILESVLPKALTKNSSRYYSSPCNSTALTTATLAPNTIYAMPLVLERATQINAIQINVTTSRASSFIRVGIYSDNGNLIPLNLILDAGSQSSATTGVKSYTTGIPISLESGLYWLVCVSNSNPIIRGFAVTGLIPILGIDSGIGTAHGLGYSANFTFGTLSANFPAGPAIITTTPLPFVGVKT
jgi:hypothetical protein